MLKIVSKIYHFILGRKFFYRLNNFIYYLSLKNIGVLNYENNNVSGETYFLKKYVSKIKNGVIFDVGANVGDYSKLLRELNKEVEIYSFEPHPITFKKLLENTKRLNIKTYNLGVGSKDGILRLYDYADSDGSSHASLYREVIEEIHKGKVIEHEVKIIDLDKFVVEHGIDRVNLLKIDTERNELNILKGFEKFISQNKVNMIHFEFNEMNTISRVFFKDFWQFLPNYNFYRMLKDGLMPIKNYNPVFCEIFGYQNIVAILKDKDESEDN